MIRSFALLAALLLYAPAQAASHWQELPPTPEPIVGEKSGFADIDGVRLYYAMIGSGPPVVMLHGGLANSDWWGLQVKALAPHYTVILVDSRGQGRSMLGDRPLSYDLMADDVVGLLDKLEIRRADIVGWSDGAITGLDLAMRYPTRVGKVFAFGANSSPSGLIKGAENNLTFVASIKREGMEYEKLSPTPKGYVALVSAVGKMWSSQPSWTDSDFKQIRAPVVIVDGDHDEGIMRTDTEYMAAAIPGAGLLILPGVSHFAFL